MKDDQGFRKTEVKSNPLLRDGIFALGVLVGVTASIVVYLGNQIWGALLSKDQLVELLPATAAFAVALVSLLISFRALIEQKKMRQAGVDPVLIAHLGQDTQHPLVITLNLSNVGAGAAMNVYARIVGNLDINRSKSLKEIEKSDFFNRRKPISAVLQNQTISYWMGTGPELLGKDPIGPLAIELEYEDIEGAKYFSSHTINFAEFEGRNANEPADVKIWRELEKIRKKIEKQ